MTLTPVRETALMNVAICSKLSFCAEGIQVTTKIAAIAIFCVYDPFEQSSVQNLAHF